MDYNGTELRLQPGELTAIAASLGPWAKEAHLRCVMEVETAGKAFDSERHVAFLFEPHKFYVNCPRDKLQEAIRQGLAYPHWKGPGSYPKTPALRWSQFQAAVGIDETAAIQSASWGLGQIMGSECEEADYNTPQEMLIAFFQSEKNQVLGMVNLIKHRGLDHDLMHFPEMSACRHFALLYNGKEYEKNNYHNKLHDSFVRWNSRSASVPIPEAVTDGSFHIGDHDSTQDGPIRRIQQLFKDKGYSILVDGKFGGGTRSVVVAWKANQGISPIEPFMTPADVLALQQSPSMPIAAERKATTVEDLKPTSTIVQKTSLGKKILGWSTGTLGVAQGADSAGLLDTAQTTVDKAQQAKGIFASAKDLIISSGLADLLHFLAAYKFEALAVAVFVGFIIMNQIQKKRVEMHQTAKVG